MSNLRDLLGKLTLLESDAKGGSMKSAAKKPTGPKFVGKMKGTDPASARYSKLVGEIGRAHV